MLAPKVPYTENHVCRKKNQTSSGAQRSYTKCKKTMIAFTRNALLLSLVLGLLNGLLCPSYRQRDYSKWITQGNTTKLREKHDIFMLHNLVWGLDSHINFYIFYITSIYSRR